LWLISCGVEGVVRAENVPSVSPITGKWRIETVGIDLARPAKLR
jgi:hypothetical protein